MSSFLRHRNKPYRKSYAKRDKRGKIPNRIDISERPEVVGSLTMLGDWEADLVLGKQHQGEIVTLAERRSRVYLALPPEKQSL
jgi:IS30 family transposase